MTAEAPFSASIVIVNWKTPKLLARCIDSIKQDRGQTAFEIIVVDNNSQDESVEMMRRDYPSVTLIANTENCGFSKGCNQAVEVASGRHVLLLNPDAVVVDDAISTMVEYLDDHPQVGAVGPKVLNPDGTLQLACRRAFPSISASFFRLTYLSHLFPKHPAVSRYNMTFADPEQFLDVDALSGSCMMVRGEVVRKIGLLDEDIFMYGEDIDWCWRVKEAGYSVMYIPSASIFHIHGASSRKRVIGTTINLHKGMEVFYRKHLSKNYWPVFNWLVYIAIWTRAAIFIVVNLARGFLRGQLGKEPALPVGNDEAKRP